MCHASMPPFMRIPQARKPGLLSPAKIRVGVHKYERQAATTLSLQTHSEQQPQGNGQVESLTPMAGKYVIPQPRMQKWGREKGDADFFIFTSTVLLVIALGTTRWACGADVGRTHERNLGINRVRVRLTHPSPNLSSRAPQQRSTST